VAKTLQLPACHIMMQNGELDAVGFDDVLDKLAATDNKRS
jgi:hypothetical protein